MSDWINRIKDAAKRWEKFVSKDIWTIGTPGEEIPRGFLIQQIRVFILLGTKIAGGTLMLRAAALTFATLLSLVPLLAVIVFVIQTFNLGERFYGNFKPFMEDLIVDVAERMPGGRKESDGEEINDPVSESNELEPDSIENDSELVAEKYRRRSTQSRPSSRHHRIGHRRKRRRNHQGFSQYPVSGSKPKRRRRVGRSRRMVERNRRQRRNPRNRCRNQQSRSRGLRLCPDPDHRVRHDAKRGKKPSTTFGAFAVPVRGTAPPATIS